MANPTRKPVIRPTKWVQMSIATPHDSFCRGTGYLEVLFEEENVFLPRRRWPTLINTAGPTRLAGLHAGALLLVLVLLGWWPTNNSTYSLHGHCPSPPGPLGDGDACHRFIIAILSLIWMAYLPITILITVPNCLILVARSISLYFLRLWQHCHKTLAFMTTRFNK